MKAERLAIRSPEVKQVETNCRENNVGCPGRNPCRDTVPLTQRQKKVDKKVHRKNEDDCCGNARENAASRIADAERRSDTHHHEARPGQSEPILQMRAKRRKQRMGEIRIETQILSELRQA